MKNAFSAYWTISFWTFVGVKVGGTFFASWSWWWVLFTPIPVTTFLWSRVLGVTL